MPALEINPNTGRRLCTCGHRESRHRARTERRYRRVVVVELGPCLDGDPIGLDHDGRELLTGDVGGAGERCWSRRGARARCGCTAFVLAR